MIDREALRDLLYAHDSDEADFPFWEACDRGEFTIQRCDLCERHYWPASLCTEHGGKAMRWVAASGRGVIHDYVIMRHAYSAQMKDRVPYAVAVVKLEEGPFYHTNIVDCPVEDVKSGLAVEVTFQPHPSGLNLPVFRPAR